MWAAKYSSNSMCLLPYKRVSFLGLNMYIWIPVLQNGPHFLDS